MCHVKIYHSQTRYLASFILSTIFNSTCFFYNFMIFAYIYIYIYIYEWLVAHITSHFVNMLVWQYVNLFARLCHDNLPTEFTDRRQTHFKVNKVKDFYYNKIIIIHRMTQRLKPIWIDLSHKFLPLYTLQRPHFGDNSVSTGAGTEAVQPKKTPQWPSRSSEQQWCQTLKCKSIIAYT